MIKAIGLIMISISGLMLTTTSVFASHSVSPNACYNDGHEAGQDGSFSQELYDFCEEYGDEYYDGFIDGCMSQDNSRDVCESATDAD